MGLLKCPDCGKEFSDRIDACSNCACPKSAILEELESKKEYAEIEPQNVAHAQYSRSQKGETILGKIYSVGVRNEAEMYQSTKNLPTEFCAEEVNNESERIKRKVADYTKTDLMSSNELKLYAIESVLSYICEELKIDNSKISKCEEQYGVDLIAKTSSGTIGIKCVIDVAPNKSRNLYDDEACKKMNSFGFKYAVAQIGIGSSDEVRFKRRIVLKNDGYLFDYRGLKYFEYKNLSNIRYSLSEDTSWKYIFEPVQESDSPYTIQKEKKSYRSQFSNNYYTLTIDALFDKYSVKEDCKAFLKEYILSLAEAIQYSLTVEETIVNFLNCVDYCKGMFLSDSKAVAGEKIILETIELLKENCLIGLDKYELFSFGFYVHYFLKNGEYRSKIITAHTANKMKIELFKVAPDLFGFGNNVVSDISNRSNKQQNYSSSARSGNQAPDKCIQNEHSKKVPQSFDDYYDLKASKFLRVDKIILGIFLIISAFVHLFDFVDGNFLAIIDIIFCAIFGFLVLNKKNWIYPLIVTLYHSIAMIINIGANGTAVGSGFLIVALTVTIGLSKLNKEYKNQVKNNNKDGDLYCRTCGSMLPKDSGYCKECGTKTIGSTFKNM